MSAFNTSYDPLSPGSAGFVGPMQGGGFAEGLAEGLQTLGPIMAIFGAANSAIGTFYQAKSAQNQLKSQALNQQFQSEMSAINAKSAEFSAQQSMAVHAAASHQAHLA